MIFGPIDDGSNYYNNPAQFQPLKDSLSSSKLRKEMAERASLRSDEKLTERKQERSESLMKIIEAGKKVVDDEKKQENIKEREVSLLISENAVLKRNLETENILVERHLKESAVFQTLARHIQKETDYPEEKYKDKMNKLFDQIDELPVKEIDNQLNEFIEKRKLSASEYRKKRKLKNF